MRRSLRLLVMLLAGAAPVAGQPTAVDSGSRVRLTLSVPATERATISSPRIIGKFVQARGDTVFLILENSSGEAAWFPIQYVSRFELSAAQYHPVVKSAAIGTAVGAVLGLLYGSFNRSSHYVCIGGTPCPVSHTPGGPRNGAVRGAAAGLVLGMITGSVRSTDRWVDVNLTALRPR